MSWPNWFIALLIVIVIGVAILMVQCVSITVIVVDDRLTEQHRTNLLVLYDIKE